MVNFSRDYMKLNALLTIVTTSLALPSSLFAQESNFHQCLSGLESQAVQAGVSHYTFKKYTAQLEPDTSLLEKLNYQPEFRTPIWDYMTALVDEERIDDGKAMLQTHQTTLKRVAQLYGVDPATVVAVWGVESNYGKNQGKYSLVNALGTLSCMGRRQAFFRKEFFATLRIIQSGDITEDRLKGSWAGAFGHTQFMPTTFERLAVDFDNDGRRDLIDNTVDALGSTANYLKKAGWQTGQPWGFEVKLPQGFSTTGESRKNKKSITYWMSKGVKTMNGQALNEVVGSQQKAGLLLPAGINGPAFLVFKNFDAIYSYNAAESYALAIAHLSDRLKGAKPFVTPWPTDDLGLSRRERIELQTLLLKRGHDIGEADGLIGSKTREAIKKEQARLGMTVDGRAGQKILKALQ
ncbi:lytic murein transglycosylase [Pelistega sp. NLN82]|uniref:Lytic murein transglycosylase n=1 Tax=Pelistega ratti TaxID=2652177 RepID=A0A6L9Y7N0_9BURK|nr:lytic murein transglycosylase [Pelistega ratti]NEN75788.1 lytic murein transglycosylase [Pelistega ratti]